MWVDRATRWVDFATSFRISFRLHLCRGRGDGGILGGRFALGGGARMLLVRLACLVCLVCLAWVRAAGVWGGSWQGIWVCTYVCMYVGPCVRLVVSDPSGAVADNLARAREKKYPPKVRGVVASFFFDVISAITIMS